MKTAFQSEKTGEWLCFKHAIKRALLKGDHIEPVCDGDDFCSEYDMRNTSCADCYRKDEPTVSKIEELPARADAMQSVIAERARQDAKWGEQNHAFPFWTGILGEEFGELCQAVNETVFNNGPKERVKGGYANMRTEAVQVAAVAVAFVEYLDRFYGEGSANG